MFAAAGHIAFPEYPESDLNLVTLRFTSGAIGKVVVAFGEPGPQDHTVRVAGTDASVRGNLLYRRDGALGEVLHRPMVFQPALLKGRGKTGGQTRYRQLRTNLPPYLFARSVEALRLLARRPNAEYGAANYPVRLYEHSLACVGAIEDFVARCAIAVRRSARSTRPAAPSSPAWRASSRTGPTGPSPSPSSTHDRPGRTRCGPISSAQRDIRLHAGQRRTGGTRLRFSVTSRAHADEFPFPRVHVQPRRDLAVRSAGGWSASVERATGPVAVAPRGRGQRSRQIAPDARARAFRPERLRHGGDHQGARASTRDQPLRR